MGYSCSSLVRQLWFPLSVTVFLLVGQLSRLPNHHYQYDMALESLETPIGLPKILVVYAGPTELVDPEMSPTNPSYSQSNNLKYHLNTAYFLKHGVQCKTQDTLIVLTNVTISLYQSQIQEMDYECNEKYNHRVLVTTREPYCYDLEAVRVAVMDRIVNIRDYDYFLYVNCGVSGPAKEMANLPWTNLFLSKLKGRVKMTGLSHNCFYPHIQSMMFALDREGLQIILQGGAIFKCTQRWPKFTEMDDHSSKSLIIFEYEIKMSELILSAGYAIEPYLRSQVLVKENISHCVGNDTWIGEELRGLYDGRIPFLNETVFFKSTRYLSPELAQEIGYNISIDYNWGI
jgi:hypothetical protein